jgi:hypothetical protein
MRRVGHASPLLEIVPTLESLGGVILLRQGRGLYILESHDCYCRQREREVVQEEGGTRTAKEEKPGTSRRFICTTRPYL